ncbi:MAG: hypothetical protein IJO45_04190 [Oscillospiraceae bacterium]|nr:hypothetical protein [Oscillospiraceae bacterium]
MKKWSVYLLLLAVIPVLSFGGLGGEDVGKLCPVQAVMIRRENDGLRIITDGGQSGWGEDVSSAMEDLKKTASANVFLDTADYLLLKPGTEVWLKELKHHLRPSCSVCYASGALDLVEAAAYLQIHQPSLTLTQYEAGQRDFSTLVYQEGRMALVRS